MTVSLLLRLAEDALACGRLAGETVVVETGERAVVRDAEELLAFLNGRRERENRGLEGCGDEDPS